VELELQLRAATESLTQHSEREALFCARALVNAQLAGNNGQQLRHASGRKLGLKGAKMESKTRGKMENGNEKESEKEPRCSSLSESGWSCFGRAGDFECGALCALELCHYAYLRRVQLGTDAAN